MRFTKPAWVMHQDGTRSENAKRLSIFSVHVHPDGSRVATGGLDAKIRIWSTKPILNQSSELLNKPPKSLCTLTMHTGPVLTVRWAHSGRWLASGSDDEIVMIWDLDPTGAGKVWGSDEVNVEGWKPLKRLPGHESDVTDLAWAPEDRYLASVGLDSKVLIWCGFTLERLRKLDLHHGFVKGVCWDPVGEFLATQSDDKTVKIWRTTDWGLEAEVKKPFEDSPGSTFFRRLSWSPDGAHITASNAMNNKGFVFVAAVITRSTWTSDISLVGHENTVEVAAYNPHIFLRNPSMPVVTSNICSVVALGADDRSVSVWQTKSARPLIVAKEVFERQILDLSWSWDGLTLYAVSSDGTMAVFNFDPEELEGIAARDAQIQYLQKFGFVPPPLPHGYSHSIPSTVAAPAPRHANSVQVHVNGARRTTPPPTPPPGGQSHANGFGHPTHSGEHVTTLVARRAPKTKKRVQPTFVGSLGGGMDSVAGPSGYAARQEQTLPHANVPTASLLEDTGSSNIRLPPPPLTSFGPSRTHPSSSNTYSHNQYPPSHDVFGPKRSTSLGTGMDVDAESNIGYGTSGDLEADMDVPISALDTRSKRVLIEDGGRVVKARTLGGDRARDPSAAADVREIRGSRPPVSMGVGAGMPGASSSALLQMPTLKTFLSCSAEANEADVLEARNSEDGSPSEVTFFSSKTVQWLDYLSSPVLLLAVTGRFCAVASEDGSLNVYSHTGRRLMPIMSLGSPCAFLDGSKDFLMTVTTAGQLHVWNVKELKSPFSPISVTQVLSPNATIISICVRPNGAPLLQLSNGTAMSYDPAITSWIRVSDAWWSLGSSHWKGRQRRGSIADNGGVIASLESRITEHAPDDGTAAAETPRPSWWTAALTLGHLESRLHSARILGSAAEYKQALLLYAKTIADEGFRGKADELLKELYGPVFIRPSREETFSPTVLGLAKRDLVKEVVNIFARSKTLYKLAVEYQELLRKSMTDE